MEEAFEEVPGVLSVTSGYIGGRVPNPTYDQVSAGKTGHTEAIEVLYDPARVNYSTLLEVFWHNIDPLTPNAQFCDHGSQYRAGIFYHTAEQQKLADASKQALIDSQRFKSRLSRKLLWPPCSTRLRNTTRTITKESPALQVLQVQLRPCPAAQGTLGEILTSTTAPSS